MPRADRETPLPELLALGRALRALREERGLKQIEVATGAGMTEPQVSETEAGLNDCRYSTLIRMLDALGVTPGEFAAMLERG
jgi:transcriptional regulator with XRE-family HTH domain